MKIERIYALGLLLVTLSSAAQVFSDTDPDWKEGDVPPPPAFRQNRLIPIDMPRYFSLRFGVDPQTLSITPDGIVRYVMVAANKSGAMNAMFEGVRCSTGQVKTYAHASSNGQWSIIQNPQWESLFGDHSSKHALAFAHQGACEGRTTRSSTDAIVNALKNPQQDIYAR
jgi:hypothetical protein